MPSDVSTPAPLMLSVSGCRGIVGASLTPEVVGRFARAAAEWARAERGAASPLFIIGRDGRAGGEAIREQAIAALLGAGCRVIDIDVASTPTCGVMVLHRGADAGLVITASHNPAEWNGLKVISAHGAAPNAAEATRIIDRFKSAAPATAPPGGSRGVERDAAAARVHVDRVLGALAGVIPLERIRARRFNVVLDSVNASGRIGGRMLLDELGCRVTHLHADASGVFPHKPEPTAENLRGMSDEARRAGAEVGFAQDPDADRLALLDERGGYVGEEYTLVLSAVSLLSSMTKTDAARAALAANLSTSRMIDDAAARFGARVVRTAVGEANVVEGMMREGAVLGGEGNGGVIWPRVVPIRDSLAAMGLTLALMASTGRRLSELVGGVPAYAIEKRQLALAPGDPGLASRAIGAIRALYASRGATLDAQDGLRADFDAPGGRGRAWLHVRGSNTEPIIRFIAEAPTKAAASAILDEAQAAAMTA